MTKKVNMESYFARPLRIFMERIKEIKTLKSGKPFLIMPAVFGLVMAIITIMEMRNLYRNAAQNTSNRS